MSFRVFNFRSMSMPTSNRPLGTNNGKPSPAPQRPASKAQLSGLSQFDARAAAGRASNRPAQADTLSGTQAAFVDRRPPAASPRPAVWRSSTQSGFGVHIPQVGTYLVGNLDEAQSLLAKHGMQFGGTGPTPAPQRPIAPPLNTQSQKPNAAAQAVMLDSRPAATSRRPAVWRSTSQDGYGVHVPGSGAFRVGTLKEARDLLGKHGIPFDAAAPGRPGQGRNSTPPPLPPRAGAPATAPSNVMPPRPQNPAPLTPPASPQIPPFAHPSSLTPGLPTPPSTPPASPLSAHSPLSAGFGAPSPSTQGQQQGWLRMPEPSDHRLPAALATGHAFPSTAPFAHPSSLTPGIPTPPPTPPASPLSAHSPLSAGFGAPSPSAQHQQQGWLHMPEMPPSPVDDHAPQAQLLRPGRHQSMPSLATPPVDTPAATANARPPQPSQSLENRPWAAVPAGMELKTWASPQHEALDRLGGPMVLSNVQPMDKKSYAGEEFGTKFGTSVKYLNDVERTAYQVTIHNGRLHAADGSLFDSRKGSSVFSGGAGSAIFVMDHKGNLYLSNHQAVGKFHHSSFLAGAPVAAAGEMVVHDGKIQSISRRSGHYKPTVAQLNQCADHLKTQGVEPSFSVLSQV